MKLFILASLGYIFHAYDYLKLKRTKSQMYMDACKAKILLDKVYQGLPGELHYSNSRLYASTRGGLERIIEITSDLPYDVTYKDKKSYKVKGQFVSALVYEDSMKKVKLQKEKAIAKNQKV